MNTNDNIQNQNIKKRVYFIYKYTFSNGKVYIGQTYKKSGRYGNPKKYSGTLVGNAMKRYPDFEKEIIEYCSKETVDEREKYYISYYDSTNRNKGYNRDTGGNLKKEFSEDFKNELSRIHTDLQVTEILQYDKEGNLIREWSSIKDASITLNIDRTAISKALHGIRKTAGGYLWRTKKVYSPYNSRPISQYDLNGNHIRDWDNANQAERELKIKTILNALNGRRKTAGGFQWKYCDSQKVITPYKQNRLYKSKLVYQYDIDGNFIKEWKSYLDASKKLNIPHQHIKRVLDGRRKMTRNYIFKYEYVEKGDKYNSDEKSFIRAVEQYTIEGQYIKTWPSITSAEKEMNVKGGIGKCCRGKAKTSAGYKWKYKDGSD